MYSELFDQLGASGRLAQRDNTSNTTTPEDEPLVSFKAGTMELKPLQEPAGSYECTPNKTRGQVRLVWKNRALQWQFYNRRDKKVVDSWPILQQQSGSSTFERVVLPTTTHVQDRIYVWTRQSDDDNKPIYQMYWMQDASDVKDDELVAQVNQYLADPQSAAPSGMDTSPEEPAASSSSTSSQAQVDALSSILENLGMPQGSDSSAAAAAVGTTTTTTTTNTTTTTPSTGTLTLADLQGAMAGIQQPQPAGPSLANIVTPAAITSLLQDEAVRGRLLELLPQDQRTEQHLEENLRSPQVQATLRSLTVALLPDDAGDLSGLYSVLANFQLDPADATQAIAAGNPIQAFLDALLKSVEKESEEAKESESKQTD